MAEYLIHLAFIGPGGPEFLVVMLVLIMMFGAKDAPRILRKLNEMFSQLRNTADGFKREVMYGDLHSDVPGTDSSVDDMYPNGDEHDEDYDYTDDYTDDFGEEEGYEINDAVADEEATDQEAEATEEPELGASSEIMTECEDDDAQKT